MRRSTSLTTPLLIAVAIVATCAFGSVALASSDILKSDQRLALELQAEREQQQHLAQQRPVWNIVGGIGSMLGLGLLGYFLYQHAQDKAVARRRIAPDANGRYALPDPQAFRQDVAAHLAAMLTAGQMEAQIAAAKASQALPQHYAPKIDMHHAPALTTSYDGAPSQPVLVSAGPDQASATLPEHIELADVLSTVKTGHLAFGILPSGELLQLPFAKAYHVLGAGDTRTGKTVLLDSMITQLHHMSTRVPLTLYGGDFKRELAATWDRSPLFSTIESEPSGIAEMLLELVSGADGHARYDRFKALGGQHSRIVRNIADAAKVTGERPHISGVVLDEINAVLEAARRNECVAEALKVLLQTGAGAGVFVLGGAQYLSAQVFSRDGSKQFTSRALFGAYDRTAAGMMFGAID